MANLGQQTGSLIDGLPPEIATQVHPDWRKNEADYWVHRDSLLANYRDQWIGFADGKVLVSGKSPVEVLHSAQASGKHPFITCVGHEHEPNRMRRSAFSYDQGYPNEPLPVVTVEFRKQPGNSGLILDHVIPDTGANASAIPWADCEQLALDPSDRTPGLMGGVGESSTPTLIFHAWVYLDGTIYPCRLQADFAGHERIMGRDVLNALDILFRGRGNEVIINP